jgi:ribose transport system permease protein
MSTESLATRGDGSAEATTPGSRAEDPATQSSAPLSIRLSRFALPGILLFFIAFFSLMEPDTFFTSENARTILTTQSVLAILAIAVCLPLIIGEFDLSVGANLGLGLMLVAGLTTEQGLGLGLGVALALLACTAIGLVNGLFVAKVGINAFIVTLGMSTVLSGVVVWYSDGSTFGGLPSALTSFGDASVAGIPTPVVVLGAVAVVVWYLLAWTPVGRYMYALGGSKEASRLAGLRVDALTIGVFVLTGFLCGVAGVLMASTLGSGNPTVGPTFLLPAFAAAFLGATAIRPGTFNVAGTVIAVFTIQTGIVGLQLMGLPYFIEPVFTGVVLIGAVVVTRVLYREAL